MTVSREPHRSGPGEPNWLGRAMLALAAVLSLVVLVQGFQLATLSNQARRLADDAAATERSQQRRIDQLADRVDALTGRVKRSMDSTAVAKHALPSVYRVRAGNSSGTAFAVAKSSDGGTYLLTNHHVVDGLRKTKRVGLGREGENFTGIVTKSVPGSDVALIETSEQVPVLRLAATPPQPGQPVVAVGAPSGLEDTVTTGVVSKIRAIAGRVQEYIQFDAAINPGNSGGPVLNAEGKVVGIATAKAVDAEGIGFALPIGVACDAFDAIC